jgi:hypothetical protein
VECIPVQVVGCIQAQEAVFTLVQAEGFILGLVEVSTLVREVGSTVAVVAECIPVPVISRIEATYHLGQYSLSILMSTE